MKIVAIFSVLFFAYMASQWLDDHGPAPSAKNQTVVLTGEEKQLILARNGIRQ